MKCRLLSAVCGAMYCIVLAGSNGWVQRYPERPINFIVPWPAGGGTDIAMRALADVQAKQMNARFVIENKPVPAAP